MPLSLSGDGAITGMVSASSSDLSTALAAKLDTPGAWTPYTPTVTTDSGAFTAVSATGRYSQVGKTVTYAGTVTITNAGTAAGVVFVSLPVTAKDAGSRYIGVSYESVSTGNLGSVFIASDFNANRAGIRRYDAASFWTSGYVLRFTITYEAA